MAAFSNRITRLFGIDYPIIQAGMVWASGWRLASAVSNAGGLGLIGSGSMSPDVLEEHIIKCKAATEKPFGVNLPLQHVSVEEKIKILIREKISIVFTSAGNPLTWTNVLKREGIRVVHVVSSSRFAHKAEQAGCDAVVAEGFEAGGHNGREETTSMVLIPAVCGAVKVPVIAAGGMATGRQMLAAMVMGAEGVQMGSRFVASAEASSHPGFKEMVIHSQEGDTILTMKQLIPVRILKNKFYEEVYRAEQDGASKEQMLDLLGKGRSRKGMFEGDLENGELEIGQVSALLKQVKPAAEIVRILWQEFSEALTLPLRIE